MLLSNCRINKDNYVTFYEQDILIDDKIYSNNIDVTAVFDYITPGIGIALIENESYSLNEYTPSYLFKIGINEYTLISNISDRQTIVENGILSNIKPYLSNIKIRLKKDNSKLFIYINDKLVLQKYISYEINNYSIGYYSNSGNILKDVMISSEVPSGWNINMSNTDGGYITFDNDTISLNDCNDIAEIEQTNIELKANDKSNKCYYLKYESRLFNGKNDIKPYIYLSNDDRYNDDEKNILINNKFMLQEDSLVNLKFKGKNGIIKNIQITNRKDDTYISTEYEPKEEKESCLTIYTKNLKKIDFSGKILNIPFDEDKYDNKYLYSIITDSEKSYLLENLSLETQTEYFYDFSINIESGMLTIKYDNKLINGIQLSIEDKIILFKNIDAIISNFILYRTNGEVIDLINQNTKKEFIAGNLNSPIIITDENNYPLSLSSSYRVIEDNGHKNYEFTNYEREIFKAKNKIKLTNPVSNKLDNIVIHAIPKDADINSENIYNASNGLVTSIKDYANIYDTIQEKDIYSINKKLKTIILQDPSKNKIENDYAYIIVDYLKDNSYCINYRYDINSYEIDISTSSNVVIHYDGIDDNDSIISLQNYKLLDLNIENDNYIVLKGR